MIRRLWVETPLDQFLVKFILFCVSLDLSETDRNAYRKKTRIPYQVMLTLAYNQVFPLITCNTKLAFLHSTSVKRMWGKGPAAILAIQRLTAVTPQVNLRLSMHAKKRTSEKSTLALKPRANASRSRNRGISGPTKLLLSFHFLS